MREIKFRAWDKESELMSLPFEVGVTFDDLKWRHIPYKIVSYDTDYIVMQYTGLKDKKRTEEYPEGQEIYEGDIVAWETQQDGLSPIYRHKAPVEYDVGRCIWRPLGVWKQDLNNPTDGYYYSQVIMFEVIGNIYENPELAEADNAD